MLTDLYYPGWEASVDGEPAEVFKVNALFRGVHLKAGRHEISYHYRPGPYHAGLGLFFITLIATAACATYLRFRRPGELPG